MEVAGAVRTSGYVSPSIIKIGGEDHLIMITASVGRGRTAQGRQRHRSRPAHRQSAVDVLRLAVRDPGAAAGRCR